MSLSESEIEILMGELAHLRGEVEAYSTTRGHYWYSKAEDWAADQARYDRALLAVARHLGVPTPPDPPKMATVVLARPDRAKIEALLDEATGGALLGIRDDTPPGPDAPG